MREFCGLSGETIVEWKLSYCLGGLLLWLFTHDLPLSNWIPILRRG
jgi:hypothetical protein